MRVASQSKRKVYTSKQYPKTWFFICQFPHTSSKFTKDQPKIYNIFFLHTQVGEFILDKFNCSISLARQVASLNQVKTFIQPNPIIIIHMGFFINKIKRQFILDKSSCSISSRRQDASFNQVKAFI